LLIENKLALAASLFSVPLVFFRRGGFMKRLKIEEEHTQKTLSLIREVKKTLSVNIKEAKGKAIATMVGPLLVPIFEPLKITVGADDYGTIQCIVMDENDYLFTVNIYSNDRMSFRIKDWEFMTSRDLRISPCESHYKDLPYTIMVFALNIVKKVHDNNDTFTQIKRITARYAEMDADAFLFENCVIQWMPHFPKSFIYGLIQWGPDF
jgi:hypothetical protein